MKSNDKEKSLLSWAAGVLALVLLAPAVAAQPLRVVVSIPPQAQLVEQLAGPHASVQIMLEPGQNPHVYAPKPRQLVDLTRADLYFSIGVPFERALLAKIARAAPALKIVDSSAGIARRRMTCPHDHEDGDDHHGETLEGDDPHLWLDPRLAMRVAANMRDALVAADPAHADDYLSGYQGLAAELTALHAELTEVLLPFRGQPLFVYHPAYGYFTSAYGMVQVPVEIEGKEPSLRQLASLVRQARAANAHVIFVQPQFSSVVASKVAAEIGGIVAPLDPLARDYIGNLRAMAQRIAEQR